MLFLLLFLLAAGASAQAPTPLAALIREAQVHNPGVQATQHLWQAAEQAIAPAGALPDPRMDVQQMSAGSPLPFDGFSQVEMTYVGVGVSQSIPSAGVRRWSAAAARQQAAAAAADWQQARRGLARQVTELYIHLGLLAQQQHILEQQGSLLRQAEAAAELGYRTARGTQADVLSAQLQVTELMRDTVELRQEQDVAQARMRSLLGRAPGAAAIVPEPLRVTHLDAGEPALAAALDRGDPALAAGRARAAAAGSEVQRAHAAGRPEFSVQFAYQHTAGAFPDRYMWGAGMSLPWLHRADHAAATRQAAETQAGAQSTLEQLQLDQRYRLTAALLNVRNDEQMLRLDTGGLLPQARAAAAAALVAYTAGEAGLETYLQAWSSELTLERQYWQTVADHETALAAVTELTGPGAPSPSKVAHD
ncbi:MAG TPA: TolC family protein [Terriglobales bacterium]